MDEATRADFVARIQRDVAGITVAEQAFVEQCMSVIFTMTDDSRMGRVTFLMPDEQAIQRIDVEGELPQEIQRQCLGLLLDQVVLGAIPDDPIAAGMQLNTLGGSTVTISVDDGGLSLIDQTGRKVRISRPIVDGPKMIIRHSNDLLMWDEWTWLGRQA